MKSSDGFQDGHFLPSGESPSNGDGSATATTPKQSEPGEERDQEEQKVWPKVLSIFVSGGGSARGRVISIGFSFWDIGSGEVSFGRECDTPPMFTVLHSREDDLNSLNHF